MTAMLSKKLMTIGREGSRDLVFYCPGCKETHAIPVGDQHGGAQWSYNGDAERPTFTPSILIKSGHFASHWKEGDSCWCTWFKEEGEEPGFKCQICHSFVTHGRIQFLNDCTHELAGQTVDLPDYPCKEK